MKEVSFCKRNKDVTEKTECADMLSYVKVNKKQLKGR